MYFSRLTLDPQATAEELSRLGLTGGYGLHRAVWRLFEGQEHGVEERVFLYREEGNDGKTVVYTVSGQPPENRHMTWRVEIKPYEPRLRRGQRLAFSLRANPVRTRRDEQGRHRRHDVVMDSKRRAMEAGEAKPPDEGSLVQREGSAWLAARGERAGFALVNGSVRADGYRQHRLFKRKGVQPIRFSSVEFSGVLEVLDEERMLSSLYRGVGPAKGFGCGLLMVRRV